MFDGKKLSIIFPAYNEEEHVEQAVREFKAVGILDEILVIDNNSKDKTRERAERAGGVVIPEERQGLGHAVLRGLNTATGDLIFLAEPDGTFVADDLWKFLAYTHEFDLVLGTRTTKELIWQGANMGFFLRVGNAVVAKLLEFLFSGCSLSDCGCTFRLIRKTALSRILPHLRVGGSHCNPELVILAFQTGLRVIEIPINYKQRVGISKITGTLNGMIKTGLRMIVLIFWYRLRFWFSPPAVNEPGR